MIRVLLAGDQMLVRAGFRVLLESAGDIAVIGEAANGGGAVALTRGHAPTWCSWTCTCPRSTGSPRHA